MGAIVEKKIRRLAIELVDGRVFEIPIQRISDVIITESAYNDVEVQITLYAPEMFMTYYNEAEPIELLPKPPKLLKESEDDNNNS